MAHQFRDIFLGLVLSGAVIQSPVTVAADEGFAGSFPVVSGKGVLTVSGEGYLHRELYDDGEVPSLSARDSSGQLLPDGMYRFQFISSSQGGRSSARQRDVLRGDTPAPANGGSVPATQLSGTFEVQGGQLLYQ